VCLVSWDVPPISDLLEKIKKPPTEEIITLREMRTLFETISKPVAYCGYEPSGEAHLGHWSSIKKLIDLSEAGFRAKVLLADYHAFLNKKGPLGQIRKLAEYFKHCVIAIGGDPNKIEFILGSSFQLEDEYMADMLKMSLETSIPRARRSMDVIGRDMAHAKVSQILYPLMQVEDIKWLDVDLALGDTAQRKVHMLARELLPKLGLKKPVALHHALIIGLHGGKMGKSIPGSYIAVHDSPDAIVRKIHDAYCPPKIIQDNPILQWCRFLVFPNVDGAFGIERPKKYGGRTEFIDYPSLERNYKSGKIHPLDLKNAVANFFIEVLRPVRTYFETHRELLDSLYLQE